VRRQGPDHLSFLGDEGEARRVAQFGSENHRRLAEIKAAWDPENVFSGNQNIRPAAGAGVA
jgi:FAD/FMN-containing dehydrogenase